eukprot:TRINITY_DN20677_c0_g1_i1.p1 TRINITY_DN20677_c0_g1~~TRINITY_DN20677_c0_g1_i1.p1  ORF type:complete len:417 (-),score=60.93 TRINITY_DN20677_c0_g1_i1:81-1238(-)
MARRRTSRDLISPPLGASVPLSGSFGARTTPRRKSWAKDIEQEILLPSKPSGTPQAPHPCRRGSTSASRCVSPAESAQAGGSAGCSALPPLSVRDARAHTSPDSRNRKRLTLPASRESRPGSSCSSNSGMAKDRSGSVASVRSGASSVLARAERSLSPDYVIGTRELAADFRQGRGDAGSTRVSLPAAVGASGASSSSSSSGAPMPSPNSRRRGGRNDPEQSDQVASPSLPEGAVALAEADAKFKHASLQMLLYNGRRDKEGKALEETVNELVPEQSASSAKRKFKEAYQRASAIRALVEGKDEDGAEAEPEDSDIPPRSSSSGRRIADEDEYWKQMWALTKTMMRSKDTSETDAEKQKRAHSQELASLGIVPASLSLIPGTLGM